MEIIVAVLIGVLAGGLIFYFLNLKKGKSAAKPDDSFMMLQGQIQGIAKVLDQKLSESNKAARHQFGESAKIIKDVTEGLARLDETNKQVIGFAEQLQSLENILKNPKQRGILGEYYLEELLKNVFSPGQYQMQYQFKDGEIADAVIFLRDNKIIPVDSKFSLENYNRIIEEKDAGRREELERDFRNDLKNRIDETAKYIRPQENTLDFAFMFIPAEAVYYDLLVSKVGAIKSSTRDLVSYAVREKHVIPVSPTSFYAYLQTILQGMRALRIERSAQEIRKRVEMLGKHLLGYEEYMRRLGGSLTTTVNSYNKASKEFAKIDKDVVKITDRERSPEIESVDKPLLEE